MVLLSGIYLCEGIRVLPSEINIINVKTALRRIKYDQNNVNHTHNLNFPRNFSSLRYNCFFRGWTNFVELFNFFSYRVMSEFIVTKDVVTSFLYKWGKSFIAMCNSRQYFVISRFLQGRKRRSRCNQLTCKRLVKTLTGWNWNQWGKRAYMMKEQMSGENASSFGDGLTRREDQTTIATILSNSWTNICKHLKEHLFRYISKALQIADYIFTWYCPDFRLSQLWQQLIVEPIPNMIDSLLNQLNSWKINFEIC